MTYMAIERDITIELGDYGTDYSDITAQITGGRIEYGGSVFRGNYEIEIELEMDEIGELVDGLDKREFEIMLGETGHEVVTGVEEVVAFLADCTDDQARGIMDQADKEVRPPANVATIVAAMRRCDIDLMAVIKQYVLAMEHGA